jgi:hypothetical protein
MRYPAVINGRFTRGKYEGKLVNQVLEADPSYIHFAWCSGSSHFGITQAQWERAKELVAKRGKSIREDFDTARAAVRAEGHGAIEHKHDPVYRATIEKLAKGLLRQEADETLRRMVQAQVAKLGPALQAIKETKGLGGLSAMGGPSSPVNCRSVSLPVQYQVGDRVKMDGKVLECTGVCQDEATFEERDEEPSFLDDPAVRELLSPVASFLD